MWLCEMLLASLVGGTVLGVGWRLFEDWQDRKNKELLLKSHETPHS